MWNQSKHGSKYGGEVDRQARFGVQEIQYKTPNTKFKILENQRGKIMDLGGAQVQDWVMVCIQASVSGSIFINSYKLMLALIVLSSITKNEEIARNMASIRP